MAGRVCPFWMGYCLLSPFRKLRQDPVKILSPYIHAGMNVLDFGSAMGYFSIPMAELVGHNGKVICVDIQERMLRALRKRAKRAGVESVITAQVIEAGTIDLSEYRGQVDFVLLFAVGHEVPDQDLLFRELCKVLKPGGKVLFSEPSGHVSKSGFEASVRISERNGFQKSGPVSIRSAHSILMGKA